VDSYRTCVKSEQFEAQSREIQPDGRLFDEALEFVEPAIAQRPELFRKVSGDLRVLRTVPTAHCPSLRIYFKATETICELLWVEESEDNLGDSIWTS
jgi:hypothetical protein